MWGIPAAAYENRQAFAHFHSQNPARFPVAQNVCVHQATPTFFPPAAPAGITHYTLQARLCAKGGGIPPLETPRFIGLWPHFAFLLMRPILQNCKNESKYLPTHPADIRFFFAPPSAYAAGENCRAFCKTHRQFTGKIIRNNFAYWVAFFA